MGTEQPNSSWASRDARMLTEDFINHIYKRYYKSYSRESGYYEKINNRLFTLVTIIGFLVTVLLGLKEILKPENEEPFTIAAFILPSISSVLLLYMAQKGFKQKEQLREDARIRSKYLVNEAKLRFSVAKSDPDFESIYRWLNEEVRALQVSQAGQYFNVHNKFGEPPKNQN